MPFVVKKICVHLCKSASCLKKTENFFIQIVRNYALLDTILPFLVFGVEKGSIFANTYSLNYRKYNQLTA